jgi:hypothetical protein
MKLLKTVVKWSVITGLTLVVCYCLLNKENYLDGLNNGYRLGRNLQIEDNIRHGVMSKGGKWLSKYELAR